MTDLPDSERIDKWLWAARFFKTRQLAADAVSGGKVDLNGLHTKPGKILRLGDRLAIRKAGLEWQVTVTALALQRGSAAKAQLLYEESPESRAKRLKTSEDRAAAQGKRALPGRPTKKDRRALDSFKKTEL